MYWETLEGGICANPAGQVLDGQPADDDSRFYWYPEVSSTVATNVEVVGEGGKWTFPEYCFDECDEVTRADYNPCGNNWYLDCENEDYPVKTVSLLTWNTGYQIIGNSDNYTFQSGLCIRYTAHPCEYPDPDIPECGPCNYYYTQDLVDAQECIDAELDTACYGAVSALPSP